MATKSATCDPSRSTIESCSPAATSIAAPWAAGAMTSRTGRSAMGKTPPGGAGTGYRAPGGAVNAPARPPPARPSPATSGRSLTDLGDLALTVTREAVEILRQLGVELRDLFPALRLAPRVAVQDLVLGHLRVVDLPDVGDHRLLRVGERALDDACLLVLLAETLHR